MWSIGGATLGGLAFAWLVWRVDYDSLRDVAARADLGYLSLVALAIAAVQLVRAWKWRQLLYEIRPIGTLRLFGAIMAGYFVNFLIPLGISPIVRSWLVARLENLKMSTVLATAAIDRLVDGVVFTGFVAIALLFAVVPDPTGGIRLGLIIGGLGSLTLYALLLLALARYKQHGVKLDGWIMRQVDRLPDRYARPTTGVLKSFAEGIVWPQAVWRSVGIVLASVVIKLITTTHFLWAGLAFGVVLRPAEYVFLIVFVGFLLILSRLIRMPGGFIIGSVFALDLLGIAEEQALAMVLVVQFSSVLTVASIGALALWRHGMALGDVWATKGDGVGRS